MKRKIDVRIELDPSDYHGGIDSISGAFALVISMLRGYEDLPDEVTLTYISKSKTVKIQDSEG